ncbi:MAG TPA: hypothetical protein VE935_15420 [Burkholderiales bacterium]|jgi:hypothetical protein|nr:hypothetical protein [Burkholderiales bacterium]
MTQDEYVAKLKGQLDQWNAQVKDWEAKAATAQDRLREQYLKQLDLMRGADQAWKSMHEAFERARSEFNKK